MPERADRASSAETPGGTAPVDEPEAARRQGPPPPPAHAGDPALTAERRRKSDGRALILYRWEGEDG